MAATTSSSARWAARRRIRSGYTTCARTRTSSYATTPSCSRCACARSATRRSAAGSGSSPSRPIRRTRNIRRRPRAASRCSSPSRNASRPPKGAPTVIVVDAIARILKIEGAEFLSAYPTTPLIEAAAKADIRPVLCRQERVGVGIADGYARVKNGKTLSVFCMQYGPGAENAFPGVATAYSDSTPMLLLPLGHQRDRAQVFPLFSSARTFASVTKSVETITVGSQVADVMRRAISLMRMGRPGPVMVEIPADVVNEEVPDALIDAYRPVKATAAGANVQDVEAAARVLREAKRPVIHAGQGVLYAEASDDLLELAELLQAPVMATMEGKSAFPEDHPLSLGTGGPVVTGHTLQYLREADVVF